MQSLIRSKSAGVTGGRGTAGAGPGRDLLYGSRGVPAAPTYRRPGDLGPYEPCPSTPRVRIVDSLETTPEIGAREEPRRSRAWRTPEVEARREVRHSGRGGLDMEDLVSSAPPRRTLTRPAIQTAVEDWPGATGSAGHPSPRQGTPGLWIRIQARSGCGTPSTPRAIGQLTSNLRSQRRRPDRPQGRPRPQNPSWSTTLRRWRGPPEPGRRLWPGIRSQRGIAWVIRPWRRSPRRREPRDAPDQLEGTLSATASTCPSSWASTQRWGWTSSCIDSTAWTTRKTV